MLEGIFAVFEAMALALTGRPQEDKGLWICGGTLLIIVVLVGGAAMVYGKKKVDTEKMVERRAIEVLATKGEAPELTKDAWGNAIKISYDEADDFRQATVISAGRDQEFGTKDDISATERDYHKTKIVGKWVGKKSIEFVKGAATGLKEGVMGDE